MINKKVCVLLSGGQDSTTVLFWAKKNFEEVYAISFNYGQVHNIEIQSAIKLAQLAEVKEHKIIDISFLKELSDNALFNADKEIVINKENNLPTTFVPGRNMIFLSLAAAWSYDKKIRDIAIGVSQVDYSGYPDCREDFINSMEKSISYAMDSSFKIHAPLMFMDKAEEILLMKELGFLDMYAYTHTCYRGSYPPCGECPACKLREEAFKKVGIEDPLIKRAHREGLL